MDWLQFTSSVIGSVAWPVALVCVVVLFRNPLTRLIDRIRKAKGWGLDVDASELAAEATERAEEVTKEVGATTPEDVTLDPATDKLLRTLPALAFTREFRELESLLMRVRDKIPAAERGRTLPSMLRYLAKQGTIGDGVPQSFQTLRTAFRALDNEDAEFEPGEFRQLVRSTRALYEMFEVVLDKVGEAEALKRKPQP